MAKNSSASSNGEVEESERLEPLCDCLPTACHLMSPQPLGFLEEGASEMRSGRAGGFF